tara:strand:- start:683 stop:826 length:144 start_codon:yes stop_codon:yes gene_type:complete
VLAGRPVSVTDVQKASGLPEPTCYRIIQSLLDHQWLDQPTVAEPEFQ